VYPLSFTFDVGKRITDRKKIQDPQPGADPRIHEVAGFLRRIKCAANEFAACSDMPCPRHDHISEIQVHTRLETP